MVVALEDSLYANIPLRVPNLYWIREPTIISASYRRQLRLVMILVVRTGAIPTRHFHSVDGIHEARTPASLE